MRISGFDRPGWFLLLAVASLGLRHAAVASCTGDCNGNGVVVINELTKGVRIALGDDPISDCLPFDDDGDGNVSISELVAAVEAALEGCADASPSATPTSTPTPTGQLSVTPTRTGGPTMTVFQDDFEEADFWDHWAVDNGTWQWGVPNSGPGGAHQGDRLIATVLDGNYSDNTASRLENLTAFIVPDAAEHPRLRFWHWFSFSCDDVGQVQIKVGSDDWQALATFSGYSGGTWSYPSLDLSAYAGQTVRVGFYFSSHDNYDCSFPNVDVSAGWYIDELKIVTGATRPLMPNVVEGFEGPDFWRNWSADNGTWEWGELTTGGPGMAHEGSKLIATVLDGNYGDNTSSRLASPEFVVPDAAQNPRLRFWHWFSFSCDDYGEVQIKGTSGDWQPLATFSGDSGGTWSFPALDLSAYAGQAVQVGFYFYSHDNYDCSFPNVDVSAGWYIDELQLR